MTNFAENSVIFSPKGEKMSMNWTTDLDMLAQNGVINFDAPAFVMDKQPRYVGNPKYTTQFNGPAPEAPLISQSSPMNDEFKPSNDKNPVKNPTWKKWLLGIATVSALVVGGYKFKNKLVPWAKKAFKNPFQSMGNAFKKGWTNFKNLFKKNKP